MDRGISTASTQRRVRSLSIDEAAAALHVLQSAARWSEKHGDPIWNVSDFHLAKEEALAAANELFGGFDGTRLSCCMRVQKVDLIYWPDDPPGEALYVHKIAVARDAAGTGWLSLLMDFADARAIAAGARFLRLDTLPRPRMLDLYVGLGFTPVDAAPRLYGTRSMIRLERPVQWPPA